MRILFTVVGLFIATNVAADQSVATLDDLGGYVEAEANGQKIIFPTLKTDVSADLQGDLATVTVVQTFANPVGVPLNATYLFPLNQHAAVYQMIMRVGDETVYAEIQRIEEARETFEQAKRDGKSAALLTQHRPNMFTQDIANLMPGLPVEVTLRYVQTVAKQDGDYQLVIPLLVGPRFQPAETDVEASPEVDTEGGMAAALTFKQGSVPRWQPEDDISGGAASAADSAISFNQWELQALPAYPPVGELDVPEQVDAERVALEVTLNAGMPVIDAFSDSHELIEEDLAGDRSQLVFTLAAGRVIDNRDFVLRYRLAGEDSQAGLLSYSDQRGGFFSLLIEPPAVPEPTQITPREMVFVLDVSGSMHGLPLDASKSFMREALRQLRPSDSFRIIRFSDAATEFSARPLAATPDNIRRGIQYTDALSSGGGTVMSSGILQALQVPAPAGSLRLVTFLTDGYIGNDYEILRMLEREIGAARLFAFGVGTSVNRFLLTEMGRVGRGFSRFMDPTEEIEAVAGELAERLQTPVLTDISIDWGGLAVEQVIPQRIPDLFAGQSLRIQGRYAQAGDYIVTVKGLVNGRRASLPLQVSLAGEPQGADLVDDDRRSGEAVALVWARSVIKDAMRQIGREDQARIATNGGELLDDDALKEQVIQLGLDFSLMTQWTSFVAVAERVVNTRPDTTSTLPVALPQAEGVSQHAYGKGFKSGATPEPETWLGMMLLSVLTLTGWLRRRLGRAG